MTPKMAVIDKMTIPQLLNTAAHKRIRPETYHTKTLQPSKSSCERQSVLYLSTKDYGINGERNPSLETYAEEGNAVEHIVTAHWKNVDMGMLYATDVTFNLTEQKIPLFGKLDGIVKTVNEQGELELFGLEIKSCGKHPPQIEEHHLPQVSLYSAIFGLPFVVLYVLRSPNLFNYEASLKEFYYRPNDAVSTERLARVYFAWLCSQTNKLPDKPFDNSNNKICEYCPFNELCWSNQLEQYFDEFDDEAHADYADKSYTWAKQFVKTTPGRLAKLKTKYSIV